MNVPRSSAAPGPVGVAVEQQAEVEAAAGEHRQRLVDVRPDRLGVDPAEVRVALLVDLGDPDPPAGQQPRQPAAAGAPHRIDQDADVGRPERVEVDRPPDEPLVALVGIEALDQAGRLGVGERPAGDGDPAVGRQPGLDHAQDVGAGRRAGRRLDLEAVVDPRVVAGGDHDPGRRAPLDDLVRAHLGGHGMDGEGDRDVPGEEHLGRGLGEMLRREAAVVGDDHALGLLAATGHVLGHAVGAAADVLERELVGDPGPPAVGSEDDGGRARGRHSPGSSSFLRLASSARSAPRCDPDRGPCRAARRSGASP